MPCNISKNKKHHEYAIIVFPRPDKFSLDEAGVITACQKAASSQSCIAKRSQTKPNETKQDEKHKLMKEKILQPTLLCPARILDLTEKSKALLTSKS